MTVKELRNLLNNLDGETTVYVEVRRGNISNLIPASDQVTIDAKTGDFIIQAQLEE